MVGSQRVRFAGRTDVGQVRDLNEDALLMPSEMALAVVADGMGGHAAGEVASQIAVDTVDQYYRTTQEQEQPTWPLRIPQLEIEKARMITAIKLANAEIFAQAAADSSKKGMGCTVEALYVSQGRVFVGHVGDSRVYRYRGGIIRQLTEDHSFLNDYRRMKELSGEDVVNFPHKNVVVRALGLAETVQVDLLVEEALVGDMFLLCSDGLSDMITDDQIVEVIASTQRLDSVAHKLVDLANECGGKDNISVMLVTIEAP